MRPYPVANGFLFAALATSLAGIDAVLVHAPAATQAVGRQVESPRVAYCINGLARTFSVPMVYASIRRNVIEPFGGEATVFAAVTLEEQRSARFVTWLTNLLGHDTGLLEDVSGPGEDSTATQSAFRILLDPSSGRLSDEERSAVREALQKIGLANFKLEETDVSQEQIDQVAAKTACRNATHHKLYPSLVAQLIHSQECVRMIMAHEDKTNKTFTHIVHLRPDATWYKPVPPLSDKDAWPANTVVNNAGGRDHALFGPRDLMLSSWFDRLRWHEEECPGNRMRLDQAVPVASGLRAHFKRLKIPLATKELPVLVVREKGTMKTAVDACKWRRHDFTGGIDECLSTVYVDGGRGGPTREPVGSWWNVHDLE